MDTSTANTKILSRLMFRLLPIQIILAAVGAVTGIVSSFFASNYVGIEAMSAIGLYYPIGMLLSAICTMLVGGTAILCGKYMGQNQQSKLQNVFSLNLRISSLIAVLFIVLFLLGGLFDLTGFLTRDEAVRPVFNRYLLGQTIGLFPLIVGNQLPAFLSTENKGRRTMVASLLYIAVNVPLNFLFVQALHLDAFGLSLASSLGMWVFFCVEIRYFLSGKSHLRLKLERVEWGDAGSIMKVGMPGALSYGYQTARGLIVNWMLVGAVGSAGLSAFATANSVMNIFWAIPMGMLAVSRLLMSVSIGEEDRQTLADVMRVMFRRFVPLMCVVCAAIIVCSTLITNIFYHNPDEPVFRMTVCGLRILPLCMPFSIICMHFVCYGQISGKHSMVHSLSLLDGVVCVVGFTALLIRPVGMNSVYIANVLNGVVTVLTILGYAWRNNRHFPRTMDELMVIPSEFGVPESERMDLSIRSMEEVINISEEILRFCKEKGIDAKRAFLSGLSMEEMAGNIVSHGFSKDNKSHSVDVRIVHKGDDLILRLKDDCIPFDPSERQQLAEGADRTKNVGLRLIFQLLKDVQYQNILGLNVLTLRI